MAQGSSSKKKKQFVDWTNLPVELLDVILGKLSHVGDYVRFGAVCKSWNLVAMDQEQNRIAAVAQQPPMLLYISPNKSDLENDFKFRGCFKRELSTVYSMGEGRFYENLKLGAADDEVVVCLGSSYGWVAIQKKRARTVTLFNPFNQKTMIIPGLPKRYGVIYKIVMSSDPSISPDDFILAAVSIDNNSSQELALFVSGEKSWHIVPDIYQHVEEFSKIEDIIFYQGRLYVLDNCQRLIAIDFPPSFPQDQQYAEFQLQIIIAQSQLEEIRLDFLVPSPRSFLAEASNGNLLLVQADLSGPVYCPDLSGFQIYRLEIKNEGEESWPLWVQMSELDNNDAIFVADNSCFCIDAGTSYPDFCSPNSIYFAFNFKDRRFRWKRYQQNVQISHIGVYNLSDCILRDLDHLKGTQMSMLPIALLHPQLT